LKIVFPSKNIIFSSFIFSLFLGLRNLFVYRNIIHRDLKPENILIGIDQNRKDPEIFAVIADVGVATTLKSNKLTKYFKEVTSGAGTEDWMAPEMREFMNTKDDTIIQQFDQTKIDIFSLGLICLFILDNKYVSFTKINSLNTNEAILKQYIENTKKKVTYQYNFESVLKSMLSFDPRQRPRITDLYENMMSYEAIKFLRKFAEFLSNRKDKLEWAAPETNNPKFLSKGKSKEEVFVLGLACLFILDYKKFTSVKGLNQDEDFLKRFLDETNKKFQLPSFKYEFLKGMLSFDPSQRPILEDLINIKSVESIITIEKLLEFGTNVLEKLEVFYLIKFKKIFVYSPKFFCSKCLYCFLL